MERGIGNTNVNNNMSNEYSNSTSSVTSVDLDTNVPSSVNFQIGDYVSINHLLQFQYHARQYLCGK